jgi:glycosyltransferase involved in cell wall biosynthesis
MKILMMTNSYFPYLGGLEQSLHLFSQELREFGHEVMIAAPGPACDYDRRENVVRLPAFHHRDAKGIEFSINYPLPGIFSKIMKEFRPDIIHSHYPFFMGDFALRLSRQYHVPLVFSYHIMFEHYIHYLPVHNEGIKRFLITLAAGYANMSQQVIAPSQSVKNILLKRRIKTPITVVPTGIDVKAFAKGNARSFRRRSKIPADALVIGHVSRLAPEKNLDFMIPALVEILKKNLRIHVLMVGRGPSVPMIRKEFKQAELSKRLHLTGYLEGQDLIDAYHAMDVFAFASLSETQGIVLTEAMAAGIPVVAINAPGVREVVKNYFNGRLIPRPDQQKFAKALEWVLKRPAARLKAIKQCAQMSAGSYSIENCTAHMLRIYKRLITKNFYASYHDNAWKAFGDRIKADWDIIWNVVKAGEAGVFNRH